MLTTCREEQCANTTPSDRSGVMRHAMSFKARHFNGGPTSTSGAATANQENVPPTSSLGRAGYSGTAKTMSVSVSCTNLAPGGCGGGAGRVALTPAVSVGNLLSVQVKTGSGGGSSPTKHSAPGVSATASNSWRP